MDLIYKENYWNDLESKDKFIKHLNFIHNLDLTLWDKAGYWDNNYRPFSYFNKDMLVSNVCVYSMDMVVNGQRKLVAQISGVGTHPDYRKQGLNLELTQKAMDWAKPNHDFFFLFADEDAQEYYKNRGFRKVEEYKTNIKIDGGTPKRDLKKLEISNKADLDFIYKYANERESVSDLLGVYNPRLFMFWCLYVLNDNLYYIKELDTIVSFKRDKGTVTVYDIVAKKIPIFSELYPYLCNESDKAVEFLFMPDKLKLEEFNSVSVADNLIPVTDNGTHLLSDFPLEDTEYLFPLTSHA